MSRRPYSRSTAADAHADGSASDVLVTLADMNPELDPIRWRVTLSNGSREYIAATQIEDGDRRALRFAMDDGTTREFVAGEWNSMVGMPGKPEPVLSQIIFRLFMFGEADQHDILNPGSWLQSQPEWIESEREHYKDDPVGLATMERIHFLRSRGL